MQEPCGPPGAACAAFCPNFNRPILIRIPFAADSGFAGGFAAADWGWAVGFGGGAGSESAYACGELCFAALSGHSTRIASRSGNRRVAADAAAAEYDRTADADGGASG